MRLLSRVRVNPDTLGDAFGTVALFVLLGAIVWIGFGLGLSMGGEELIGRGP